MTAKPIPSPPKVQAPPQAAKPREEPKRFTVTTGTVKSAQRIGIYGESGAGKTSLTSESGRPTLFIDLQGGTRNLDVARIEGVSNWDDLRFLLRDKGLLKPYDIIAIDTGTEAQDLAEQWTIKHVPNSSGKYVQSLKHFGYGEGYSLMYDTFCLLLQDMDGIIETGKHVVMILHATPERVPNPAGDDYLQVQPRLLRAKNADLRARVREWLDHLFYLEVAKDLAEGGKVRAAYRLVHPTELPHAWAKSRTLSTPMQYDLGSGSNIWQQILR
mgnify:FL=1